MSGDVSRRGVLRGLAALGVAPGIPVSDLDCGGAELPDVPDVDAIWLVLSMAVGIDDVEEVLDSTNPITCLYSCSDADLSSDDVRELVCLAAQGEFTERKEYIRQRLIMAGYERVLRYL